MCNIIEKYFKFSCYHFLASSQEKLEAKQFHSLQSIGKICTSFLFQCQLLYGIHFSKLELINSFHSNVLESTLKSQDLISLCFLHCLTLSFLQPHGSLC